MLLDLLMIVIAALLLIMSYLAVSEEKPIKSVVFLSTLSMLSVIAFILLKAPDVAITEAVVGSGLVTALFVFTLLSLKKKEENK